MRTSISKMPLGFRCRLFKTYSRNSWPKSCTSIFLPSSFQPRRSVNSPILVARALHLTVIETHANCCLQGQIELANCIERCYRSNCFCCCCRGHCMRRWCDWCCCCWWYCDGCAWYDWCCCIWIKTSCRHNWCYCWWTSPKTMSLNCNSSRTLLLLMQQEKVFTPCWFDRPCVAGPFGWGSLKNTFFVFFFGLRLTQIISQNVVIYPKNEWYYDVCYWLQAIKGFESISEFYKKDELKNICLYVTDLENVRVSYFYFGWRE